MRVPHTLTLEAGRAILREGKPFVSIHRDHDGQEKFSFHAAEADAFAWLCTKLPEMVEHLQTARIANTLTDRERERWEREVEALLSTIRGR